MGALGISGPLTRSTTRAVGLTRFELVRITASGWDSHAGSTTRSDPASCRWETSLMARFPNRGLTAEQLLADTDLTGHHHDWPTCFEIACYSKLRVTH